MRYLVDNMVQRSVTKLLQRLGRDAIEVREVLAADALDPVVAEYAVAEERVLITHDSGMAARCLALGLPHIWLRMSEALAEERLEAGLDAVEEKLVAGELRVELRGPRGRRPG